MKNFTKNLKYSAAGAMLLAIAATMLTACSAFIPYNEEETPLAEGKARISINVSPFESLPFPSRSMVSISEVCNRLSFVFFSYDDGRKLMTVTQEKEKEQNFGKISADINPGTYILVTIGHNGLGNCTVSSPTEVTFKDNKCTDTFSSCDTITIAKGEQTKDISLKRQVGMFRLVLEESVPEEVAQLKFYYTGGSSTFNAAEEYGSKNSRQTEILDVPKTAHTSTQNIFEVYTFPRKDSKELKMTITALDGSGNTILTKELLNVPIERCVITQYQGKIFTGGASDWQFSISAEDQWTEKSYKF